MFKILSQTSGDLHAIQSLPVSQDYGDNSIGLIYMPWGGAARGSIALGILKQLARKIGVNADIHYLNIKFAEMLGFEFYESISDGEPLMPEWFFSHALFGPDGLSVMSNSWDDLMLSRFASKINQSMEQAGWTESKRQKVIEIIPQYINECLTTIDWSKYKMVGFSSTFAQTTPSLLLAKRIKDSYPEIKVVFGGANADSVIGLEILKAFDWVDYVVHGEAENTFPRLLHNVFSGNYFETIPGVSIRKGTEIIASNNTSVVLKDLNESPIPDYTDYLKEVERLEINKYLTIVLPFESSRGCWWGAKAHCTFCGLNGGTMAFRQKDPDRVYEEIITISNKYRCLRLDAVDNIIDTGYMDTLLPRLAEADIDLSLFYEVKASLTKEEIRRLWAAGVSRIQPGIESLNTEILRLMRKGTTAGQNIQLMKLCLEYNITPAWNLLYGFPGEKPEQYKDLPDLMRSLMHLHPPAGVNPVVFERFSPYHFDREKFNLKLKPISYYSMLYPEQMVDFDKIAYYFEGEWEGGQHIEEYIAPAKEVFKLWEESWKDRKIYFSYEKGPGFVTLTDNRPLKPDNNFTARRIKLNEVQSSIYVFCDQIQSFVTIKQMLNNSFETPPTDEQTRAILDRFVQHGLMFREAERYLSLAVRRKKLMSADPDLVTMDN
jgi:ribosomal peptide maturation radical SAM protein 1